MGTITLNELKKNVDMLVKKGLGDRKILISTDDEGNGFHELFYLITPNVSREEWDFCQFPRDINLKEYVVLG